MSEFERLFGSSQEPQAPTQQEPVPIPPPAIKAPMPKSSRVVGVADRIRQKDLDAEINDFLTETESNEFVPEVDPVQVEDNKGFLDGVKSFFGSVYQGLKNVGVQTSRNITGLKRDIQGKPITDIPEPILNKPDIGLVEAGTTALGLYGAPSVAGAVAGGKLGLLGGPAAPVTVPLGALAGGIAGAWGAAFLDDPRTENLADVVAKHKDTLKSTLQGTVLEDMDVVIDAISESEIVKRGADNFEQRINNANVDLYTGAILAPVAWTAGAIFDGTLKVLGKGASKAAVNLKTTEKQVLKEAATKPEVKEALDTAIKEEVDAARKSAEDFEATLPKSPEEPQKPEVKLYLVDPQVEKNLDEALPEQIKVTKTEGRTLFAVPTKVEMKSTDESVTGTLAYVARTFVDKFNETRMLDPVVFKEVMGKARAAITDADRTRILSKGVDNSLDDMAKLLVMFEETAGDYVKVLDKVGDAKDMLTLAQGNEATKAMMELAGIWSTVGTEQGRVLGFRRMLGQLAAQGDVAAQELVSSVGKLQIIDGILKKEGVQTVAERIQLSRMVLSEQDHAAILKEAGITDPKILAKIDKVRSMTASEFKMGKMGKVAELTRGQKINQALLGYVSNNLLTPWTFANVGFSTSLDTLFRAATNYVKIPIELATGGGAAGAKAALAEASMYARVWINEANAARKASWHTLRTGQAKQGTAYASADVADSIRLLKSNLTDEQKERWGAFYDGLAFTAGVTVDAGKKLLRSAETGIHHLAYNAHVKSKKAYEGLMKGLSGDELEMYIHMSPTPPSLHAEGLYEAEKALQNAVPQLKINRAIESFSSDVPIIKYFNLFYRAAANSVERTLEYVPGLSYFVRQATVGTTIDNKTLAAKQMVGATAMSAIYYAYENGTISKKPKKGSSDVSFLEPDIFTQTSGGQFSYQINTPMGNFKAPAGSVLEKLLIATDGLHTFAQSATQEESELATDALALSFINLWGGGSAYQGDLEFLTSLFMDGTTTEQSFKQFSTSQMMKAVPLAPVARKTQATFGSNKYMMDLRPDPTETVLEHMKTRLYAIYDDRGFGVRRNAFGEKVFEPQGFLGLNPFTTPTAKRGEVLEYMRAIEDFTIERSSLGFQRASFSLPSRNINISLPLGEGGDVENVSPAVPLPRHLYERLLDYYAEGSGKTGSLRSDLEAKIPTFEFMLSRDIQPEVFNMELGDINEILNDSKELAKTKLMFDQDFLNWQAEMRQDIIRSREKLFKEEIDSLNKRVNVRINSR